MRHYPLPSAERVDGPNLADLLTDEQLARELLARILGREAEQPDLISERELVAELARMVLAPGDTNRAAKRFGVCTSDISRALSGERVSRTLARALGYRKVVRYERCDPSPPTAVARERVS